jgi:hypothetical protein
MQAFAVANGSDENEKFKKRRDASTWISLIKLGGQAKQANSKPGVMK